MLPRLETERLILRSPRTDDLENIYRLGSSPNVMRYISNGKTQTKAEAKADLDRRIKTSTSILGYWIVEEKATKDFVGWLALKRLDNTDDIEVGYRFLEEYWGQGLATEGSRCLLAYAFQQLNLPRIVAIALEANKASTRVMEKLGMRYCKKDQYYGFDVVVYEIFQKDFIENIVN